MKKYFLVLLSLLIYISILAQTRIKDISYLSGLQEKDLIGYGLIIGLDGSGDGGSSQITTQSLKNMMERFGISVPVAKIRPNNIAAVMITATLPPFAKLGSKIDVSVSSVGDARSLEGGTLLMSELRDTAGDIIAIAQGPVSIGGFNTAVKGGRIRKNYALSGRVPDGATVKKEFYSQIVNNGELLFNLHNPDFSTAVNLADKINDTYDFRLATTEDATSISVIVPDSVLASHSMMNFISKIENLSIATSQRARVVINERTGTIVAGGNVTISEVAISHGSLVIEISSETDDGYFGTTTTNIDATTDQARVLLVGASTVSELAQTLNKIKVTPRDLISIFQSIKISGALQAELVIM